MAAHETPSSKHQAPSAICMECGELCNISEDVETLPTAYNRGLELWCYCSKCDVETFHAIPDEFNYLISHKA
jgi:hypothetical protein